jgi:predicted chitinase
MEFIITGVNHKINSNVWTTDLKTIMVPNSPVLGELPFMLGTSADNQGAGAAGAASTPPTPTSRASSRVSRQIPESKRRIVEKIINFAKSKGITDKERLTALLTVAQAESGLTPGRQESFLYSLARAKQVFPGKLRGLSDKQILDLIPKSKGGRGSQQLLADKLYGGLYGNGINEGYKYSGKGMTQITFKGNYTAMNKNFRKYNLPYDIINNPQLLSLNEDADVALLVIGKLEGQFGNKLRPGISYSTNPQAIIATQDGGKSIPSPAPLEVYRRALSSINNTQWIQDLLG